jgi:hypothetical protein
MSVKFDDMSVNDRDAIRTMASVYRFFLLGDVESANLLLQTTVDEYPETAKLMFRHMIAFTCGQLRSMETIVNNHVPNHHFDALGLLNQIVLDCG